METPRIVIVIDGGMITKLATNVEMDIRVVDVCPKGVAESRLIGDPPAETKSRRWQQNQEDVAALLAMYFPNQQ
jgi:hypothetical protein